MRSVDGGLGRKVPLWLAGLWLFVCLPGTAAFAKSTGDAMRFYRLGQVQMEQGQTLQAIESLHKAIALNPKLAEAHYFLGIVYLQQSDVEQAAKHLKKAVGINPYYTDAHSTLGVAYTELKKYDRALEEFQTALKDRSYQSPETIRFNMGKMYLDRGMNAEAIHEFEEALRMKPDYLQGLLGLGQAYQGSGRSDLAAQEYRKVVRLAPNTAEAAQAKQLLDRQGKREGS